MSWLFIIVWAVAMTAWQNLALRQDFVSFDGHDGDACGYSKERDVSRQAAGFRVGVAGVNFFSGGPEIRNTCHSFEHFVLAKMAPSACRLIIDQRLAQVVRMKENAVLSHVAAQRERLLAVVECGGDAGKGYAHCIVTRLSDDTNIWTQGSRNATQDRKAGKTGSKKVTTVLGLCERLRLRGSASAQTIRLHCPAQVLPQASWTVTCHMMFVLIQTLCSH